MSLYFIIVFIRFASETWKADAAKISKNLVIWLQKAVNVIVQSRRT